MIDLQSVVIEPVTVWAHKYPFEFPYVDGVERKPISYERAEYDAKYLNKNYTVAVDSAKIANNAIVKMMW